MSLTNQNSPDMPYVYQEYPKWVCGVIVNNVDEEQSLLLGADTQAEREALILLAAEKGIKIDGRWSDDTIRAAIQAATPAPTEAA